MGSFNDFLGNKEIEHHEKYQTIINALGYEEVKKCVPFSLDKIEKSMKEDIYLNNLPSLCKRFYKQKARSDWFL